MRLPIGTDLYQYDGLLLGMSLIAITSMLVGNLLALKQDNYILLLAYSSIAHLAYLLITLVVYRHLQQPAAAVESANLYVCLCTHFPSSLCAVNHTLFNQGRKSSRSRYPLNRSYKPISLFILALTTAGAFANRRGAIAGLYSFDGCFYWKVLPIHGWLRSRTLVSISGFSGRQH